MWSYWEGPRSSSLLDKCLESWRRWLGNAGWEIQLLGPGDLRARGVAVPPEFAATTVTTRSDYIRLALLLARGGVWMDATVFLTESLGWVEEVLAASPSGVDVVAFRRKPNEYVENWFLAVRRPGVALIGKWLQVLTDVVVAGAPFAKHPVYARRCQTDDEYFVAYQAYCHVVNTTGGGIESSVAALDGAGRMYSPWKPQWAHAKLCKFTSKHRAAYNCVRFPLAYVYLLILLAALSVVSVSAMRHVAVARNSSRRAR